jgi:hypothetical protein
LRFRRALGGGGEQIVGTEEARQVVNAVAREQFGTHRKQGTKDAQIGPVLTLAERPQERGRLVPSGIPNVSSVTSRAAVCSAVSSSVRARPLPHGREMSTRWCVESWIRLQ